MALFFNTSYVNLKSKRFRQALAYAIPDKQGSTERALSPISNTSWAFNPQVKSYEYDLQTAKNLLSQEFDGEFKPAAIELTTTPAYVETAEKIMKSWKELGIETNLKIVNFPDTNDYQVLLIDLRIPTDPDQYALWHSTQPTNFTRYNSPRVDKLLEDGRKTLDPDKRKVIYQDFQRFLVEDSPAVFLNYLTTYTVERK